MVSLEGSAREKQRCLTDVATEDIYSLADGYLIAKSITGNLDGYATYTRKRRRTP